MRRLHLTTGRGLRQPGRSGRALPGVALLVLGLTAALAEPARAAVGVSWVFGNSGFSAYVLQSFDPAGAGLGTVGASNPTLTLHLGLRYQVTVSSFATHPLEIIGKGTGPAQDEVLLSMAAGVGSLWESDPDVNWQDNGTGTVSFTLTPALRDAMLAGGRTPGYRCHVHTGTMRGAFIVMGPDHAVSFTAGPNGSLDGVTSQTVPDGGSTTPVRAVPDPGFHFLRWTAGGAQFSTDNPLTLTGVSADLTLAAEFQAGGQVPPEGRFEATVTGAAAAAGRGLWDLTGVYALPVAGNPLVMDVLHDERGRLSGTAACTLAKGRVVTMPVRGSVTSAGGSVVATISLRGADPTAAVSLTLSLHLTLDPVRRLLQGTLTGSLVDGSTVAPVAEAGLALSLPAAMDGSWTLGFQLHQAGKAVTGTAVLTLANGVAHAGEVRGETGDTTTRLSLVGAPGTVAAGAIRFQTTTVPQSGSLLRLDRLWGRGYGQTVAW